ncbi:MAG TPA: allantoate amidohydrolase, partial [Actinomycetes bacterium]|nr:allantoate amidohydrolase [Actinomycetes bacterium]
MSGNGDRLRDDYEACFGGLAAIGRDPAGGWTRLAWTDEDRAARSWFEAEATARGLTVDRDPAGNLWAWLPGPAADQGGVVAVGSHLDTVREGGAYDG